MLTRLLPLPLPHGSGSKWSVIASTLLAITPQPRPDGATSASGRNGLIEGERLQAPPHRLRVQSFPEPLLVGWIISRGWWLSYDDPRSEPRKGGHWLAAPSQRRHAAEKKHGGASKRLAGRMKYDGQRNQLHKYGRAVERFSCVHLRSRRSCQRPCIIGDVLTVCDERGLRDFRSLHIRNGHDDALCQWASDLFYRTGNDLRRSQAPTREARVQIKLHDSWLRYSESLPKVPRFAAAPTA